MFLSSQNSLVVLLSLLFGAITGELLKIEDGIKNLGRWLESKFMKSSGEDFQEKFVKGFLTASLVFCVGPMTILGSIQDGLTGDYNLLAIKSVLDGFAAMAFASSLGVGGTLLGDRCFWVSRRDQSCCGSGAGSDDICHDG